jgi:hypothetical protein
MQGWAHEPFASTLKRLKEPYHPTFHRFCEWIVGTAPEDRLVTIASDSLVPSQNSEFPDHDYSIRVISSPYYHARCGPLKGPGPELFGETGRFVLTTVPYCFLGTIELAPYDSLPRSRQRLNDIVLSACLYSFKMHTS